MKNKYLMNERSLFHKVPPPTSSSFGTAMWKVTINPKAPCRAHARHLMNEVSFLCEIPRSNLSLGMTRCEGVTIKIQAPCRAYARHLMNEGTFFMGFFTSFGTEM